MWSVFSEILGLPSLFFHKCALEIHRFDWVDALKTSDLCKVMRRSIVEGIGYSGARLMLVWSGGVDAQCVDFCVHQIRNSRIHEAVASDKRQSLELLRDNSDMEMSHAGFGAGVPDVFVAFICYCQLHRI